MISSNEDMDALDIMFSKGEYKLTNIKAYTLPFSLLFHPGLVAFRKKEVSGKEILNGSIDMPKDGYFVTSYTFSKGYIVCVDGKEVAPVQVNKAFLGFPLQKGRMKSRLNSMRPVSHLAALSLVAFVLLIFYNTAYGLRHKIMR